MKRADRLKALIQVLRAEGHTTAEQLAAKTGVSLRTIYRDMATLQSSGVPVSGSAGTGYVITAEVSLPAINMSMDELEAMHVGLMAVAQGNDLTLANAAQTLAQKLDDLLPEDNSGPADRLGLTAYPFADAAHALAHVQTIRQAVRARQKLEIRVEGQRRIVRPLKLAYWGRLWSCIVWCETTSTFVDLSVSQITELKVLPGLFVNEAGKTLADYERL